MYIHRELLIFFEKHSWLWCKKSGDSTKQWKSSQLGKLIIFITEKIVHNSLRIIKVKYQVFQYVSRGEKDNKLMFGPIDLEFKNKYFLDLIENKFLYILQFILYKIFDI